MNFNEIRLRADVVGAGAGEMQLSLICQKILLMVTFEHTKAIDSNSVNYRARR